MASGLAYQTYIVLDSEIGITNSTSLVIGVLFPSISAGFGSSLMQAMMSPYTKHVTTAALGGSPIHWAWTFPLCTHATKLKHTLVSHPLRSIPLLEFPSVLGSRFIILDYF